MLIQKDLTAVQKTQVIPEISVDSTYSNEPLREKVEEKMEIKLDQSSDERIEIKDNIENNSIPSSDIKMKENEKVELEEKKLDRSSDIKSEKNEELK